MPINQRSAINERLPLTVHDLQTGYPPKQNYQAITTVAHDVIDLMEQGHTLEENLPAQTGWLSNINKPQAEIPNKRAYSWPLFENLRSAHCSTTNTEHVLVPAGHMALVEGWDVGVKKAAVVLGIQSMLNALPIWLSLRAELGDTTLPDWHNWQGNLRAMGWTAMADWGSNITDTIYLQSIRAQLSTLPNWAQEFLSSTGTCFLDIILTTPLFYCMQKAVSSPELSVPQVLSGNSISALYAGAGAMLTNNLIFMNVFYPINELSISAFKAEHSVWRQVAIGILASLVATTAAWPAEWLRAQLSMPENQGHTAWQVLSNVNFSLPTIFKGFSAQLVVAVVGGIFSGLANKFMRQVPPPAEPQAVHHNVAHRVKTEKLEVPLGYANDGRKLEAPIRNVSIIDAGAQSDCSSLTDEGIYGAHERYEDAIMF